MVTVKKMYNSDDSLFGKLNNYSKGDVYPFHMPGHKRQTQAEGSPCGYDITEIDGFDNLHEPEGILRIAMDEAAELYGTKKTYFMVNGSSGGILAAISAVTDNNDKILVARNCHRSVYNAIYLKQLYPVYFYPEYIQDMGINGGINVSDVERELKENKDIKNEAPSGWRVRVMTNPFLKIGFVKITKQR